jgi:hypothetical protein
MGIQVCLAMPLPGSGQQRVRVNLYGALLFYLQIAQKPATAEQAAGILMYFEPSWMFLLHPLAHQYILIICVIIDNIVVVALPFIVILILGINSLKNRKLISHYQFFCGT